MGCIITETFPDQEFDFEIVPGKTGSYKNTEKIC